MSSNERVAWIKARYSFLARDFGFHLSEEARFGVVEYVSPLVRIIVCWYRDPGVVFFVQPITFWIRAADPRIFDLSELVLMVNPEEKIGFESGSEWEEQVTAYLDQCAALMAIYAVPVLKGDIAMCEDVLITQGLKALKATQED